jgi:uncharacterized protein (TIGR03435 family)
VESFRVICAIRGQKTEQLGLKIESVKAPAEVFVIDKVEKPSAN